nr:MAG TPA: hypothetical protein [Caudoviricetes sp.]
MKGKMICGVLLNVVPKVRFLSLNFSKPKRKQ